ncbi:Murein DD-endopeptidase MepM and murein hydrolase activator NlpD, contain LysM domain [Palleronia marisminoris]|uniref:Murein hydrolase activator NlpD n=1 Tax=Palleronia marisminoris TaxID=315423 RepID=A0A1Y5RU10_9RHOB|nr:peptidoglycan DD-metalloendopeptidase family protein [Palleronia marisminoris]SFG51169.1 Murein DD-endopeptidase MepM and murein hydrolase activator NlpD, contain LysM domain [Palleronia marisminoris]SLN24391.1 Murein hydrolase activator NlpD precursor [Palleronia marisminoris]
MTRQYTGALPLIAAGLSLAACAPSGWDVDLRDRIGAPFGTSSAVMGSVPARPDADNRGVISYPDYQVAVARRDDTVGRIAQRVGLPTDELATYNGLPPNETLREGELIALPRRVAEPSPATGAPRSGPVLPAAQPIATTTLENRAEAAIDRGATVTPAVPSLPDGGQPVRHRVEAGETAFSISRRYGVPVQALAEWNGLDEQMTVRRGAVLLVPAVATRTAPAEATSRPGEGTLAPPPPSASEPLPDEEATQAPPKETPASPTLSQQATEASSSSGRFAYPVQGRVIRAYSKGKNDGIDIAAAPGTTVNAAADGTVAAITRDTDQIPILVLRHPNNVLTVYAGVDNIAVEKGDSVTRGQSIARIRAGDAAALHFEVREGFESVDPSTYLD